MAYLSPEQYRPDESSGMSHYSGISVPQNVADIINAAVDHETSAFSWTYLDDGRVQMDLERNKKVGKYWVFDSVLLSVVGNDDTDACTKMAEAISNN